MCNCGSRSQRSAAPHFGPAGSLGGTGDARLEGTRAPIAFTYLGRTALTAIGPVTGASYRFAHPGARVNVDVRDAAAIEQIPVLHRI